MLPGYHSTVVCIYQFTKEYLNSSVIILIDKIMFFQNNYVSLYGFLFFLDLVVQIQSRELGLFPNSDMST